MGYKNNKRRRAAYAKKKIVAKCRPEKIKDIEGDDCNLTCDQYKGLYKDLYKGLNYDWNQPLKVRNTVL